MCLSKYTQQSRLTFEFEFVSMTSINMKYQLYDRGDYSYILRQLKNELNFVSEHFSSLRENFCRFAKSGSRMSRCKINVFIYFPFTFPFAASCARAKREGKLKTEDQTNDTSVLAPRSVIISRFTRARDRASIHARFHSRRIEDI